MSDMQLLLAALRYAAEKHKTQARKGADKTPYINHLIDVASILAECGVTDIDLLVAAVLHDVHEDQQVSLEEIASRFNADVARIIGEVSDDKALPKQTRKQLQIETAPRKSAAAKQLKIADKISNIREVAHSPALGWDFARRQEYLDWAKAVVDGCRGTNEGLDQLFDASYAAGCAALESERNATG